MSVLAAFLERFSTWWRSSNSAQRTLLVGGILAGLTSLAVTVYWSSRPDYVVLFSGLDPDAAGPIVEELDESSVPYRVTQSGRTIEVPSSRVGELRIRVAGKGLTGDTSVGYEIFDKSSIGMTEFLQHVNYRRALEGELMRTIASLDEVKKARVHLAIPEKSVFSRDRVEPTASIIVDLMPGAQLRADQVRGIRALLAASVEGLNAGGVTIIDSTGRELGGGGRSGEFAATTEQLMIQRDVESYLREKATTLLEQVVGSGQVNVQVNAELDFERVERSVESYEPASAAIRSEQRVTGAGQGGESQETVLTNYEIDKTVESILTAMGTINRMSVAVLVNGVYTTQADGTVDYADRPQAELETLKTIIQDAVGYDETRGDSVEIANLRFAVDPAEREAASPMPWWLFFPSLGSLMRSAVVLLAIGLVAWGLRQSSSILVQAVEADRRRRERVLAVEKRAESEQDMRKEVIREEMHNLVHDRPSEVAQVLRGWLVEENTP